MGEINSRDFRFVAGNSSLDFVNTVGAWISNSEGKATLDYKDTPLREKLDAYSDLVAWNQLAGLLNDKDARHLMSIADKQPKAASAVIKRGLKLRASLYRLYKSVIENWQPESIDIDCLNNELHIARQHQSLVQIDNKFSWGWDNVALDLVLWPLASSAAELLSSADLSRVRQCVGDECGWLFLDTSRNRSRQWCEMSDCGNLAKIRRFRLRQAQAQSH